MEIGEFGELRSAHLLYEARRGRLRPTINVADTLYSGGFLGGVDYYSEHHFQVEEALAYTRGEHSIMFGAGLEQPGNFRFHSS